MDVSFEGLPQSFYNRVRYPTFTVTLTPRPPLDSALHAILELLDAHGSVLPDGLSCSDCYRFDIGGHAEVKRLRINFVSRRNGGNLKIRAVIRNQNGDEVAMGTSDPLEVRCYKLRKQLHVTCISELSPDQSLTLAPRIGKLLATRLKEHGINTVGDLASIPNLAVLEDLRRTINKARGQFTPSIAKWLWEGARASVAKPPGTHKFPVNATVNQDLAGDSDGSASHETEQHVKALLYAVHIAERGHLAHDNGTVTGRCHDEPSNRPLLPTVKDEHSYPKTTPAPSPIVHAEPVRPPHNLAQAPAVSVTSQPGPIGVHTSVHVAQPVSQCASTPISHIPATATTGSSTSSSPHTPFATMLSQATAATPTLNASLPKDVPLMSAMLTQRNRIVSGRTPAYTVQETQPSGNTVSQLISQLQASITKRAVPTTHTQLATSQLMASILQSK